MVDDEGGDGQLLSLNVARLPRSAPAHPVVVSVYIDFVSRKCRKAIVRFLGTGTLKHQSGNSFFSPRLPRQ